jgi:tetratricopeptide (TPR) repeat protein
MIAARLDLLPPAEKSLLQDAAVLGEVFWAGAAAALQEIDPSAAEAQLRALERKQFLQHAVQSSVANESEYAFGHLLLRDIAYAQIPRAARATKHQQAAAWIESLGRPRDHAEALAHHYTCALELTSAAGDDKVEIAARARVALRDAGDRAGALNAAAAAARYYERALELWPEHDHERPQLLFRYASALHTIGDPRQEQMLAQARELLLAAGDIDTAAQADALLAYMWWLAGADEGIERHLLRAAALVLGRPPSAAKARVLALISRLSMLTSKNEEAIRSGREALTIADTLHLPELRADALISVGMGRLATWDAAGVVDIERGLELALAHNALSTAAGGYTNLAAVMLARGDLVRQEQLLAQSEVLAQRLGDPQRIRLLRAYRLTSTPFWRGDWDEVLRFADEFIAECEAGAPHMMESGIRVVRATIRLARDDTHGALADCEKAVAHARHVGQPDTAARVLGYSAGIYLELGRLDQAQTLADEALSYDPDLSLLSLALAWDTDALGRRPEVVAALALLPSNNPWRRGAELIREGRFDRAADTFAEIGASMQEARTRLRAAQTLAKQSRNDDAEKQLEKALVFYRSVQATRYIRQAEALLAGTRTGSKRDRGVVALPTADT